MVVSLAGRSPVAAPDPERGALTRLARFLQSCVKCDLRVVGKDGEVVLPTTAAYLLREVVEALARDEAVAVIPLRKRLNTFQAAELLTVPHDEFLRLLESGAIPFETEEAGRYVQFDQLMAYRERDDEERRAGLIELIRLSEELGLYDDDPPVPPRPTHDPHDDASEDARH